MFNRQRLAELEEVQRLLVAQADLHRGMIRLEFVSLKERLGWIGVARQSFQAGRPLFLAATALVGGVAATKWRKLARWVPAALSAWRWVRPLLARRSSR